MDDHHQLYLQTLPLLAAFNPQFLGTRESKTDSMEVNSENEIFKPYELTGGKVNFFLPE